MIFLDQYRFCKRGFSIPAIIGDRIIQVCGMVTKSAVAMFVVPEQSLSPEHLAIVRKMLYEPGEMLLLFVIDDVPCFVPFELCLN